MICPVLTKRLTYISCPCEGFSLVEVFFVRVVFVGFHFKWIVSIGNVMTLTLHTTYEIEKGIEYPMK